MIAYHVLQLIVDSAVMPSGKVFYGNLPFDIDDVVAIIETGGTRNRDSCIETMTFDIYARFCSPSDMHKAMHEINQAIDLGCVDLPDVSDTCCKDPEFYNSYQYRATIESVSTYESLDRDSSEKWVSRWSYQIKYTKKET